MKTWRQTRLFECPDCGQRYRHDESHDHFFRRCPARQKPMTATAEVKPEVTTLIEAACGWRPGA